MVEEVKRKEDTATERMNKLAAAIAVRNMKMDDVANAVGICRSSFSMKLNGKRQFDVDEAKKIVEYLNLTEKETFDIFFAV